MYIEHRAVQYYAYTGAREAMDSQHNIVFVHGASMDHTVWSHQSRYFAYHGYNVYALDLPGHKFSAGKLLDRIEDMAQWLGHIVEMLPHSPTHFVGHSMGSLICLHCAAHCGHPPRSLSLLGFSYPMSVSAALMDAAQNRPDEAYSMMTQWSHASATGGEPVPGFWSSGMQMSMMKNSAPGSLHANLRACDNYAAGEAALAHVTCPTLFLSGQLDKMAPAKLAVEHAKKHPDAEIVLLPGCGHNIMAESPHDILDNLRSFIGRHG